jgi:hypothetical protein
MPIKIVDVSTDYIPLRAIFLQYFAIICFVFYQCYMGEARHCEAERLSTRTGAYFNTGKRSLHKTISPKRFTKWMSISLTSLHSQM